MKKIPSMIPIIKADTAPSKTSHEDWHLKPYWIRALNLA